MDASLSDFMTAHINALKSQSPPFDRSLKGIQAAQRRGRKWVAFYGAHRHGGRTLMFPLRGGKNWDILYYPNQSAALDAAHKKSKTFMASNSTYFPEPVTEPTEDTVPQVKVELAY